MQYKLSETILSMKKNMTSPSFGRASTGSGFWMLTQIIIRDEKGKTVWWPGNELVHLERAAICNEDMLSSAT